MNKKYILGLDNGGTNIKGAIYDKAGNELFLISQKIDMFSNRPGHTSRDSELLWELNLTVIKQLLEKSNLTGEDIAAIGVTGHGNGLYLTKKDGTSAYNGIISTDSRGTKYAKQWNEEGVASTVRPITHQAVWSGQPTAILKWFKEKKPEVLEETDYIFMCKDYLKYRLTGNPVGELTDMTATGLMNVKEEKYDVELLKHYGLEDLIDKLPPNKEATEINGYITKEVAELTGLKEGTPVSGGMHDIHAMAVSTGGALPKTLTVIAGTWAINEFVQDEPVVSEEIFMSTPFPGDKYLITEATPTSASNLEWFLSTMLKDIKLAEGETIYDFSTEQVKQTTPYDSNIVFLPLLYGSEGTGTFVGIKGWNTRQQVIRSIYEGIVFKHKYHVDHLIKHAKVDFDKVRIAGGVVNSPVWLQMFADILELPIEVINISELGCLGAALTAGVSVGMYDDLEDATKEVIETNNMDTYYPNPDLQKVYREKFELFKEVNESLTSVWDKFEGEI